MRLDQVIKLIAAGGAGGMGSAGAGGGIFHRLGQETLEEQLAAQRDACDWELEIVRNLSAGELRGSRLFLGRQQEAQREELLLDRLSKNPTDEQRNEIMRIQWARDIARGLHLEQQDDPED